MGEELRFRAVEEGLEEGEVVPDVEAVGQGVVDLDRVGQEDPVPVGEVLPPGDPGDGVGREADRVGECGERDPGDRGVIDYVVPVRVLGDGRVCLRPGGLGKPAGR